MQNKTIHFQPNNLVLKIKEYMFLYKPLLLPSLSSPNHKQLLLAFFSKTPEKQWLQQVEKKDAK